MSGTKVSMNSACYFVFWILYLTALDATLCIYYRFIQYEFKALVCLLLQKLDMRVAPNQTLPGVRPEMEGVGVSQPKEDFFVEIQKKRN